MTSSESMRKPMPDWVPKRALFLYRDCERSANKVARTITKEGHRVSLVTVLRLIRVQDPSAVRMQGGANNRKMAMAELGERPLAQVEKFHHTRTSSLFPDSILAPLSTERLMGKSA